VCVEVGGHVRATGVAPGRSGWAVPVGNPLTSAPVTSLRLRDGAVGTSARMAPTSGTDTGTAPALVAVTVVAAAAWHANALARAALRGGYRTGRALVQAADAAALFCFTDGDVRPTDGWHQFLA